MAYSSITKPSDYFNTKLWTGNGTDNNGITGVGFQPDMVWLKQRDGTNWHTVFDVVRGATKRIFTNSNEPQDTNTASLKSFDSDGFTLGTNGGVNGNTNTYVAWNWLAGGSGSANTDGTISSTVSANTTSGCSVVKYTGNATAGATVGHGLGAAPKMILFKNLDSSSSSAEHWLVYHESVGNTHGTFLNTTSAEDDDITYFNDTSPTSSVFSLGSGDKTNKSGEGQIAYCFAEKKGYSKFGTYRGNGNANGTFIYTGFKPAFLLVKRFDNATGGSWILYDNKRGNNVRNPVDVVMAASNNQSESDWGTNYDCDFLSNGIKWRYDGSAGYGNTSGASYLYMAFAENPLVVNVSGGIPATAR